MGSSITEQDVFGALGPVSGDARSSELVILSGNPLWALLCPMLCPELGTKEFWMGPPLKEFTVSWVTPNLLLIYSLISTVMKWEPRTGVPALPEMEGKVGAARRC